MSQSKPSPSGGPEAAAASSAPTPKKKRLLLVEDENAARIVLLQKMRAAGFEVDTAPNGRVALEKLRGSKPDVIFMDLLLPEVKGVDVIREARRTKGFGNRPIYVCTSAANMEAWTKRGTKAGATKIFDRAATAIDAIVAEVAADIIGPTTSGNPTETHAQDKVEPTVTPEAPAKTKPTAAATPALQLAPQPVQPAPLRAPQPKSPPPPPAAQSSVKESPGAEFNRPAPSFFQRALKAIGLAKPAGPSADPSVGPSAGPFARPAAIETPAPVSAATTAATPISTPKPVTATPSSIPKPVTITPSSAPKPATVTPANQEPVGPAVGTAPPPPPSLGAPARQAVPPLFGDIITPSASQGAAVLTLDQAGKILSADEGCIAMFGWEATALVDVDLRVLLKGGLDRGVEAFLREHRGGDPSKGSGGQPLVARRKDGSEFPVSVTTLTWSSETTLLRKSDAARACWTAIFRDLTHAANPPAPEAGSPGAGIQPMPPTADFSRLQQSHAALQLTNSDLQRQLQELAAEAAKQREALSQSQKEREEWEKRIRSKELELNLAQSATEREGQARKQIEQKLQELSAANSQLTVAQKASAESKRRGEELENRLRETVGDLECLKADAATRSEETEFQQSAMRDELNEARKAAEQADENLKKETARNQELEKRLQLLGSNLKQEQNERSKRFEQELAALRKERDDLNGRLTAEQHAVAESRRRAEELEGRLRDNSAAYEIAKTELDKQTTERKRSEAEWRGQLENAKALTRTLEAACAEAVERNSRFEGELACLQLQRDELQKKLVEEQQTAAEPQQRVEELEMRLSENAAELERVKTEVQNAGRDMGSEMELVSLEQVRDALSAKLTAERWAAAEASKGREELEAQLRANAAELERVKADMDKQAEAHAALEADLREQLDATKVAVEQVAAALTEKAAKCNHLQSELAGLQQLRDELSGKLTTEQQAAAESKQRSQELESRLQESAAELERYKAEREKQAQQQARVDFELQTQLSAAKATIEQVEASLKRESVRCSRFEEELVNSQKERRQLRDKCDVAQQAEARAKQRIRDLEEQLREREAGIASVKLELQTHSAERGRCESDLRAQLDAAKSAAQKADAGHHELTMVRSRLEEELAGLRRGHDEVSAKWKAEQRTVEESRRRIADFERVVGEKTTELQRAKTAFDNQSTERARTESDLRAQLEAAKNAAQKADAARQEQTTQRSSLQQELSTLRKNHEELGARCKAEQQTAEESKRRIVELEKNIRDGATELQRAKTAFDSQSTERGRIETDLRTQLESAKNASKKAEAANQDQIAQRSRLEKELAGMRKKTDELGAKGKTDQKAAEDAKRRIAELEKTLSERATEMQRAKTTFETQSTERARIESELRAQLEAAKSAAQKGTATQQELNAQRVRLQEELSTLKKAHDELGARCQTGQSAVEESRRRIAELEKSLRESSTELQRTKTALEERSRQAPPPPKPSGNTEAINKELCRLKEDEAVRGAELSDLRRQMREGVGSSARLTADLEKERAERRRIEQRIAALTAQLQELHDTNKQHLASAEATQKRIVDLEQQLRDREDSVTRVSSDLMKEASGRHLAEEQLRSTAELNGHLRNCLSSFELAKKGFKRMQEELEARQQANLNALKDTEAKLQAEAGERKRLEEALAAAQRSVDEQAQKSSLELTKLQSELEVEKFEQKRLQGEALQSRYSSLDSARVGQAMVNSFRKQIEQPVDQLMQSTRRLLESQLEEEQKKLVESLLENALLLRTSLQDSGPSSPGADRAGSQGPPKSEPVRPPGLVPPRSKPNLQP